MSDTEFKEYPDSGSLKANSIKKSESSPDYWGTIAIDLSNTAAVKVVDGLSVFKISGWKKRNKEGQTYLSLSINRYVPEHNAMAERKLSSSFGQDDDVPF
jgi:uncharacterized protein (DUF736 family)